MERVVRGLFMHLGSMVAVIVYLGTAGGGGFALPAVQHGLRVALVVHVVYMAVATAVGERKQFDWGMLAMFGLGALGAWLAPDVVLPLFQRYFGVILFAALALTALIPLLLGRETFTYYYARRQGPAWQEKLPEFPALNRFMTGYWALLFVIAGGLVAWAPLDWRFTLLYPNLVIFGLGMTAPLWLLPLYFKWKPPALPTSIEPVLLGMPLAFDRKAAQTARASFQFHVSGAEAGDYVIRVADGRCESFAGRTPAPDVTVHTPDAVWLRIVRGELDGIHALQEGLYRADGDLLLLARLSEWFPVRR